MRKSILILLIILILTVLFQTQVQAFTFNLNVHPNKTVLQQGEEIRIKISVSDIDRESDGINAISGIIEFDKEVFENLSIVGLNNWTSIINDEPDSKSFGKFIIITTAGNVVGSVELGEITLKVKQNIELSETTIKFKELATSYNQEEILDEDQEIAIKIDGVTQNVNNNSKLAKEDFIKIGVCVLFVTAIVTTIIIIITNNKKNS